MVRDSLVGILEAVVGEVVASTSNRQTYAILVVFEHVVGDRGVEALVQRHTRVTIVVDVVAWTTSERIMKI